LKKIAQSVAQRIFITLFIGACSCAISATFCMKKVAQKVGAILFTIHMKIRPI
jgi:hypothetical protein